MLHLDFAEPLGLGPDLLRGMALSQTDIGAVLSAVVDHHWLHVDLGHVERGHSANCFLLLVLPNDLVLEVTNFFIAELRPLLRNGWAFKRARVGLREDARILTELGSLPQCRRGGDSQARAKVVRVGSGEVGGVGAGLIDARQSLAVCLRAFADSLQQGLLGLCGSEFL